MLNISSGRISRAQKVVIYGAEGIGKSTLASRFPNPLFIDTEGGTSHMDVRRIEKPASFDALIEVVNEVAKEPNICSSLILDTADWAEQLCITGVCAKYKKTSIEDFGYGKGYTYLSEEFSRLLAALDSVIAAGIHVVITAHAKMRKFEQPDEMGAYDRWEMKLTKQVAPLLKEWCDILLFCNYKTFVVTAQNDTKKVQGGKRVMFATHHPCWDAKNRHGLADEMDLDYGQIAHLFAAATPTALTPEPTPEPDAPSPLATVKALMEESKVVAEEVQEVVAQKGHFPVNVPIDQYPENFLTGWIIPHWQKIVDTIEADPNRLPF